MPTQSIFRWPDGRGWLIFSGGGEDVRALALGRTAADGGVACLTMSGDSDMLLDDVADLGAPSGYVVDVLGEDDQTVHDQLAQAGTIIITGGESSAEVRGGLFGLALEGIQIAYQNGAVILLEDVSAMAFGAWLIDEQIEKGLGWLEGTAILTGSNDAALSARPVFAVQPDAVAVAIMPGSALAFGPDGQIEAWGEREITVALGPAHVTG